jgi:hypothetical protein
MRTLSSPTCVLILWERNVISWEERDLGISAASSCSLAVQGCAHTLVYSHQISVYLSVPRCSSQMAHCRENGKYKYLGLGEKTCQSYWFFSFRHLDTVFPKYHHKHWRFTLISECVFIGTHTLRNSVFVVLQQLLKSCITAVIVQPLARPPDAPE